MNTIELRYGGDEEECLIYFEVRDQNKSYHTGWYDVRDFHEFPELLTELREEVKELCEKYHAVCDTSSDDIHEWE